MIFLIAAMLSLIAAGTSSSELFTRTISAASMAISVPAPIAIPMFALVSAGASFIPSPTIMTFASSMSSLTTFSLPSGSTPAITLSTPTWAPIAFAVLSLSPVSMTIESPIFCISSTAFLLSSFTTSATAIIPSTFPFPASGLPAKNIGVFPCSASMSA